VKKLVLGLVCCATLLCAEEVVSLTEDSNLTEVLAKPEAIENHDVQFALELGAKTDFWEPGLSKKEGQDILEYDTKGLYLGYAILKTKIYNTDVFTLEKFSTLKSGNEQKELLSEYRNDKKEESSINGFKMSIHLMKILNYWFDSDFLSGLEYKYQTRNFIGKAKLQENALYWFGESPGLEYIDFFSYNKDSILEFQTKFTDHRLVYTWNSNKNNINYVFGVFDSKWSKPAYIGVTTKNSEEPVLFSSNYRIKGVTAGFDMTFGNLGFDIYYDYGIDNKFELTKETSAKDLIPDDMDLHMYTFGAKMDYTIPNI